MASWKEIVGLLLVSNGALNIYVRWQLGHCFVQEHFISPFDLTWLELVQEVMTRAAAFTVLCHMWSTGHVFWGLGWWFDRMFVDVCVPFKICHSRSIWMAQPCVDVSRTAQGHMMVIYPAIIAASRLQLPCYVRPFIVTCIGVWIGVAWDYAAYWGQWWHFTAPEGAEEQSLHIALHELFAAWPCEVLLPIAITFECCSLLQSFTRSRCGHWMQVLCHAGLVALLLVWRWPGHMPGWHFLAATTIAEVACVHKRRTTPNSESADLGYKSVSPILQVLLGPATSIVPWAEAGKALSGFVATYFPGVIFLKLLVASIGAVGVWIGIRHKSYFENQSDLSLWRACAVWHAWAVESVALAWFDFTRWPCPKDRLQPGNTCYVPLPWYAAVLIFGILELVFQQTVMWHLLVGRASRKHHAE